jgi:prevent-host-death family protein
MKTESLREVKNNLSKVIEELPETGPVLITKNGTARALLVPVDEETDLEALILSNSRKFWELFDRSARSKKWTSIDEL